MVRLLFLKQFREERKSQPNVERRGTLSLQIRKFYRQKMRAWKTAHNVISEIYGSFSGLNLPVPLNGQPFLAINIDLHATSQTAKIVSGTTIHHPKLMIWPWPPDINRTNAKFTHRTRNVLRSWMIVVDRGLSPFRLR